MIDIRDMDRNYAKKILDKYEDYQWSVQGFGMLRAYLDPEQIFRIHVWIPSVLRVDQVSDLHDHPWDFQSKVVWGELINRRYEVKPNPLGVHRRQLMQPGVGAKLIGDPQPCDLLQVQEETYFTGGFYSQKADEIHRTEVPTTAISIIKRRFRKTRERAYTFHQGGRPWVSAKPRPSNHEEVKKLLTYITPYL